MATPIGNLRDITLRALDVLAAADLVACEDTRVTGRLLQLLGLKARMTPYHDHNADAARPALMAKLAEGRVVALVSDAGTPLVSDPGFKLVQACVEAGIPVTSVPGPSAALTGLQLSGLPADRFLFAGFLPNKTTARRAALKELDAVPATLIFFESPHRTADTLADMAAVLGDRLGAVARELTKMHEEVGRAALSELARRYAETSPRGEVVIVVAPPGEIAAAGPAQLEERLRAAIQSGSSIKDASALVAAETGSPRRDVYALALRLFRGGNEE
ncbi:16S rRNA (cytidine(1402)-2'-O)-methyltransferase [Paramagnetospirillum kuznetsovii]|uniref:16S rRNA (cytidine(1402)-2'-O)-methyltransferase n=1 Tax=Paramagnetospirillum kuznetsovii TaxID=2053833 RepID=UPI001EFCC88A|nr:16S rRNA (cytidine(1402)-2'-O)-methyltransferase [Paramagnetospirillum kuznetsovii]